MIDQLRSRMEALQDRADRFSSYFIEWMKGFVDEHNANTSGIATNAAAIAAAAAAAAAAQVSADLALSPGFVRIYAGAVAPNGWIPCDGAAVSRATYAALFNAIGTTFGVGDGSTTFNVPDVRGRSPLGAGAGAGLTARALGDMLGVEAHQLALGEIVPHNHSTPAHQHQTDIGWDASSILYTRNDGSDNPLSGSITPGSVRSFRPAIMGASTTNAVRLAMTANDGGGTTGAASATGAAAAHNNMQPSAVFLFVIKT